MKNKENMKNKDINTMGRRNSNDKAQLTPWKKLFYGVGHVQNDLCASMWFSYMLLFMHKIVAFSNINAGYIVLVGQIADGLATPFVGVESDKTKHGKYGRRKKWHLFGFLCVTFSFPFLFSMCIYQCSNAPAYALMIYYVPFIVIFQFGWAAVQISHLSLIPELTSSEQGKVELNAIRYFFTVMSNLLVFIICFILFATDESGKGIELSRRDAPKFQILGIAVVLFGAFFMFLFHVGVKEEEVDDVTTKEDNEISTEIDFENNKTIKMWFKTPLFYQVGGLYMLTRLIVNVTQIYVSYFVLDTLQLSKNAIAIAPAVIYISGIIASLIAKRLNSKLGLKWTFFFGCCLIYGASAWFYVLKSLSPSRRQEVYGACILLGMGGSTLLINSLAMISEMIGKNTGTSAFVFGSMSFLDKVSNGGAVILIQYLHPCKDSVFCCAPCQRYYRFIMSAVPGGFAVLALLVLLTLTRTQIGAPKKYKKDEDTHSIISSCILVPDNPSVQE